MANPTVSITSTLDGDYILTVNLSTSDASKSGKAFVLSVSDYDGFPDPNRTSSFPIDTNYPCGWNLNSSNLGNLTGTFYVMIPAFKDLPNQIEWTLEYTSGTPSSGWANVN